MPKFDYEGAKAAGYTDQEINDFLGTQPQYKPTNQPGFSNFFSNIINNLSNFGGNFGAPTGTPPRQEEHPQVDPSLLKKFGKQFDVEGAIQAGWSPDEINEYLEENAPKRSAASQAGKIGAQFGLGAAERLLMPYELATAPMASKEAQQVPYREQALEDIARLEEQKMMGLPLDEQDQALYDSLINQIQNPEQAEQFIHTEDIGLRGLVEKATGLDLQPEGFLEKSASWSGFIKEPQRYVRNLPLKGKDLMKMMLPSGTDVMRGLGASAGYEMAKNGDFGPAATIMAEVIGDAVGGGIAAVGKGIMKPRETLAKGFALFTPKDAKQLQTDIINDFRAAGIQADIGTITGSDLVKATQTQLAQSRLTGDELEALKEATTKNIKEQYRSLAEGLGEKRFQTLHEAGETGKEYLTHIRDAEKTRIGKIYDSARNRVEKAGQKAVVDSTNLAFAIRGIEKALKPGGIKSAEQQTVLNILEKLKGDVFNAEGQLKNAKVNDLINNKIALNDIINYEVQGGQKQLLKNLVKELDSAIVSYGKKDPNFAKEYLTANKEFAQHAKTFRNNNINRILTSQDPQLLMNKMNSVQGVRDLEKALNIHPEGKRLFGDLKRLKLDQMVGDKMIDNATDQLKMGQFKNLLKNPKDAQIARELLGKEAFERLMRLQKAIGKLQDTASKFYNASKSGTTLLDAGIVAKGVSDLGFALAGNPWPVAKTISSVLGGRYIARLMADPQFLKLVEEAVMASTKNDTPLLLRIGQQLEGPIKAAMMQEKGEFNSQDIDVLDHTNVP